MKLNKNRERDIQIGKEVKITALLYLFYFVWWYFFAYSYGENVEEYTYILGLPTWFFMSCVAGLVVINILVYLCVKYFFKDMDLD